MTRNRRIHRCSFLALLVALGWTSSAGATAGDDVADRQLGQSSFFNRGVNLVDARGLASPLDVAIDRSVTPNRLYVADSENSRVLGWSDATGFATGAPADLVIGQPDFASSDCALPPNAASLCGPRAVAVDGFGNLYVSDADDHRVLEYDTPFTSDAVADVVFGQDGDFTTGTCNGPPDGLCSPIAVALDVANNLYVIDSGNDRVLVYAHPVLTEDYDPDLVIPADCDAATSATSLCGPRALAVDAAGNLYVADTGSDRVLEYDSPLANGTTADRVFGQGGDFTTGECNAGGLSADSLCSPIGLALTDDGSLLVTDGVNNRVLVYDTPIVEDTTADRVFGQGGVFTTKTEHCNLDDPGPTASGFCGPSGLALDADGSVYVADSENHRVLAFDAAGTGDPVASRVLGQTSFGNGGQNLVDARGLNGPGGLAIDRSATPARLYVADQGNHRVLAWADAAGFANGAPADLVIGQPDFGASGCDRGGRSALTLCGPSDLAVDQAGNLYVADNDNSRVLEYDTPFASDGTADRVFGQDGNFATDTCSVTGLCKPRGVALDGAGNLYVADSQNHRVLEYDAPLTDATPDRVFGQRGSFATTDCNQGGRDAGSLCDPAGVAVDANGNVYVADKNNSRVLEYDLPLTTDVTADRVFGQQGSFTTGDCNDVPGDPNTFCFPYGVATDAAGNLWITYRSDDRLVELDAPLTTGDAIVDHVFGEVGTGVGGCDFAGRGPRGLCGPGAPAIDATGNLYVADGGGNRVLSYDSPLPLTPSSAKGPRKCQQTIVKASAAFFQATTSTRRKCEEGKIKGKIPACPDAKTTTALGKLRTKLTTAIAKGCCGKDKQCTGGGDDQTLVDIGWNVGGCPTFSSGGCVNRIADAADVATCLACLGEATVGDVLDLTYGPLLPSNPKTQKALNGCQQAIGKGATTFAAVKSKALAKCWDTVSKGKAPGPCPDAGANTKIAKARAKAIDKTCKACGGGGDKAPADGHCDAASTLDPHADIGFYASCPGSPVSGPVDCGDLPSGTLDELVACVDCVTSSIADCADRGAVPAFASYPLECRP